MSSSFMTPIAGALGRAGVRVVRFEFPYMAEMPARRQPQTAELGACSAAAPEPGH